MPAALAHTHPDCEVCTMSPDDTSVKQGDPVAVILARMEVKLDNALTEQARHGTRIDRHDDEIDTLKQDVAVIKATDLPGRLTAVEKKVWAAAGVAALLTGSAAAFVAKVIGA